MNRQVDEKVIKMSLENGQFESAIDKTIASIDKLEKKLEFKNTGDGFNDIQKNANKVDLSHIEKSLNTLTDKFNMLEMIGTRAMMRISDKAVDAGFKIAKALTIKTPLDGLDEYTLKLNSIQTILANTRSKGTQLKDVTAALDELNTYADKTTYVFSDMTRAIGQFTTAGVNLDQSVSAIKGMSNLAAAVGADNAALSRANYQVSQALNAGKFHLMDWRSLENAAGMGGEILQDALKETAKEHGIAVDSIIAKRGSFRESLRDDWLTADIYLETMKKFSDPKNYPQYQFMEDAATKVRTFKKLVETTMESIGSKWANIWETIIGDFDEATALWSAINQVINGTNSPLMKMLDGLTKVVEQWDKLGGRRSLIEGLANVFATLWTWIRPVVYAFRDMEFITGKGLAKATKTFADITKGLQLTGERAYKVYTTFKGIFTILETMWLTFKGIVSALSPLLELIPYTLGKIFNITGDLGEILYQIRPIIKEIIDKLSNFVKTKLSTAIALLKNAIDNIDFRAIAKALDALLPIIVFIVNAVATLINLAVPFINFLANSIPKLIEGMGKLLGLMAAGASAAIGALGTGLGAVIGKIENFVAARDKALEPKKQNEASITKRVNDDIREAQAKQKQLEKLQNGSIGVTGGKYLLGAQGDMGLSPAQAIVDSYTINDKQLNQVETSNKKFEKKENGFLRRLVDLIDGMVQRIKEFIKNIPTYFEWTIKQLFFVAGKIVDGIKYVASVIWEQLLEFKKTTEEKFQINWGHVFAVGALVAALALVIIAVKAILTIVNFISNMTKAMKGIQVAIIAFAKGFNNGIFGPAAQFILGLGILAASIVIIAKEWDSAQMWGAFAVVMSMTVILGAVIIAINKLSMQTVKVSKTDKVYKVGSNAIKGLGMMMIAMMVMIHQIKGITAIELVAITGILGAMLLSIIVILNMARDLSANPEAAKAASVFEGIAKIMNAVSMSMLAVSLSLRLLSDVKWYNLDAGTWTYTALTFATLIGGVALIVFEVNKFSGTNDKNVEAKLAIIPKIIGSVSLMFVLMSASFKLLSTINWDEMGIAAAFIFPTIILLLGAIAGLTAAAIKSANQSTKIGKTFEQLAAMLKSMSKLMLSMAAMFFVMGFIDWENATQGILQLWSILIFLGALIAVVVGTQEKYSKGKSNSMVTFGLASMIRALSVLLLAMAGMFMIFQIIDWDAADKGYWKMMGILFLTGLIMAGLTAISVKAKGSVAITGGLIAAMTALVSSIGVILIIMGMLPMDTSQFDGMTLTILAITALLIVTMAGLAIVANSIKATGGGKKLAAIITICAILPLVIASVGVAIAAIEAYIPDKIENNQLIMLGVIFGAMMLIIGLSLGLLSTLHKGIGAKGGKKMATMITMMSLLILFVLAVGNAVAAILKNIPKSVPAGTLGVLITTFAAMAILVAETIGLALLISKMAKTTSTFVKCALAMVLMSAFMYVAGKSISDIIKSMKGIEATDLSGMTSILNAVTNMIVWTVSIAGLVSILIGALAKLSPIAATFAVGTLAMLMWFISSIVNAMSGMMVSLGDLLKDIAFEDNLFKVFRGEAFAKLATAIANFVEILSGHIIGMWLIGKILPGFSESLKKLADLDPDKTANNLNVISKSIVKLGTDIKDNQEAVDALISTMWKMAIPVVIVTAALTGLIFVLGVLSIIVVAVAGLLGLLGDVSIDDIADKLAEALESDKVKTVAEKIGELIAQAVAGIVEGLYNQLKSWADDLLVQMFGDPLGNAQAQSDVERNNKYQVLGDYGSKFSNADIDEIAHVIQLMLKDPNADQKTLGAWEYMYHALSNGWEYEMTLAQAEWAKQSVLGDKGYQALRDRYDKEIAELDLNSFHQWQTSDEDEYKDMLAMRVSQGAVDELYDAVTNYIKSDESDEELHTLNETVMAFYKEYGDKKAKENFTEEYNKTKSKVEGFDSRVLNDILKRAGVDKQHKINLSELLFGVSYAQIPDTLTKSMGGELSDIAFSTFKKYKEIGKAIPEGLVAGIREDHLAEDTMRELGNKLPSIFRTVIDSHSPSKVFYEIGSDIVRGLANGINDSSVIAEQSMIGISAVLQNAISGMSPISTSIQSVVGSVSSAMGGFASIGYGYQGNVGVSPARAIANEEAKAAGKSQAEAYNEGLKEEGAKADEESKSTGSKILDWLKEKGKDLYEVFKEWGGAIWGYLKNLFPQMTATIEQLAMMLGVVETNMTGGGRLQTDYGQALKAAEELSKHNGKTAEENLEAIYGADIRKKMLKDRIINQDFGGIDIGGWVDGLLGALGLGDGGFGDVDLPTTAALADAANSSTNKATGADTSMSGQDEDAQRIQDIIFNQYNYSPEELDRTEIYKQTKAQINAFKEYMQYY